ncbi:MAG: hypothetical protein R8K21_05710 [Mariprofundales bacterium]
MAFFISFLLYAATSNMITAVVWIAARKKGMEYHYGEYLCTYLPWLTMFLLAQTILGDLEYMAHESMLMLFFMIFQSVGAGALGGLVLLPRLFTPPKDAKHALKITFIAGLAISVFYGISRSMLYFMLAWYQLI